MIKLNRIGVDCPDQSKKLYLWFPMDIKPIKTDKDYEKVLQRLAIIFDALPNTIEGDEADILSLLIDNYENQYHVI